MVKKYIGKSYRKAKKSAVKIKKAIVDKLATLVTAAFGFVAALAME